MLANLLPEACGVGGRWSVVGGGHGDLDFRHFALTLMNLIFYLLFGKNRLLYMIKPLEFSRGFFLWLYMVIC